MANVVYVIPKLFGMRIDTLFWAVATALIFLIGFLFILVTKGGKALRSMIVATLLNRPLIAIVRKDRVTDFEVAKYEAGNFITKRYGEFASVPEAVYRLKGGGGVIAFADERIGTPVPTELAAFFGELKKRGVRPEQFALAVEMIKQGAEKIRIKTIDPTTGEEKEEVIEIPEKLKTVVIPLKTGKLIDLQTVANYFIYNINPNFITARVEKRAAMLAAEIRGITLEKVMKWVAVLGMGLIFAAIAWTMVKSGAVQGATAAAKGATAGISGTIIK